MAVPTQVTGSIGKLPEHAQELFREMQNDPGQNVSDVIHQTPQKQSNMIDEQISVLETVTGIV